MIPGHKVIELKELRIGNILSYKGQYVHVTLISIDADDEYEDTIGFCPLGNSSGEKSGWNRSLADGLDRIPLSPEILEKCGFDLAGLIYVHQEKAIILSKGDDGYYLSDLNGRPYSKNQQFVHQLQNLYFALTGQDLNFVS